MPTSNPIPTQQETLEPTLEELAEQASFLLLNLSGGADTQLRRAKQIAFALRANIANRRAAVAGPRGDVGIIYRTIRDWLTTHERLNRELEQGDIGDLADAVAKAVAATSSPAAAETNLVCPFCNDTDFDLPGLKHHLLSGYCDQFNGVPTLDDAVAERLRNATLDVRDCEQLKREC